MRSIGSSQLPDYKKAIFATCHLPQPHIWPLLLRMASIAIVLEQTLRQNSEIMGVMGIELPSLAAEWRMLGDILVDGSKLRGCIVWRSCATGHPLKPTPLLLAS